MANDYIYFKGTKCTDLKAYNTNGSLKKQVNYAYYKPVGSSYATCVYKRTDPGTVYRGSIYISGISFASSSVNIDNSQASYRYPNQLFNPSTSYTTVQGATPSYISGISISISFKNQYYTPVDYNGTPVSSDDISYYNYNMTGSITYNKPYYTLKTNASQDVRGSGYIGTFTVTSANLKSNDYQYISNTITFSWTNARWTVAAGGNINIYQSDSKIARDISIGKITLTSCVFYLYLKNSPYSSDNVYEKALDSALSLTCVKSTVYPILSLYWYDDTIGSEYYFSYRSINTLTPSGGAPNTYNSWIYTETYTGSYTLYNFNSGTTDINFSATGSNLAAKIKYNYLTFTWISGYDYNITNTDKISHTVYYNKKKCNEGDAKNWTGLSDVTSINLAAGATKKITLQSNWWANSQTCSFTTRTYRYISYIKDGDSSYRTNKVSI